MTLVNVSAMPVLHIVLACVCVLSLWNVGLTSDQAVTSSLFPSSTILMLKSVMNYFLQSFPFLLIERRTVVSHWQNPTPGPSVSIRWEQLGVISLPSPPINWEIIQMRTQLSNNIVRKHYHENSREVLVYQWSNVRHGTFRSRFLRSISAGVRQNVERQKRETTFKAAYSVTMKIFRNFLFSF